MKVVFMGTPEFSLPVLDVLCKEHEVVCVYTQAPKEAGRGKKVRYTPIHEFALTKGIEVRTPKTLRNDVEQENFKALGADIAIVAAYGLILPKPILEAFPKGCINVHASLLPRWRGAAPIQRAIEAGDDKSGITIMYMAEGLDTGDMLLKGEVPITDNTTGGSLHDEMSVVGASLILETLKNLDTIKPEVQDDSLTCYAKKIEKEESKLDFSMPAVELERKVRAFNPYPATYFEHSGERFKVLKAKVSKIDRSLSSGELYQVGNMLFVGTSSGILEIIEIQREGKKMMKTEDLLKGYSFI